MNRLFEFVQDCENSHWKEDFINKLYRVMYEVTCMCEFKHEVKIDGFINIEHRQRIRDRRYFQRADLDDLWGGVTPQRAAKTRTFGYTTTYSHCGGSSGWSPTRSPTRRRRRSGTDI
ncbi:hypothetical protein CAJAP_01838 [Camponotus japonicus]